MTCIFIYTHVLDFSCPFLECMVHTLLSHDYQFLTNAEFWQNIIVHCWQFQVGVLKKIAALDVMCSFSKCPK